MDLTTLLTGLFIGLVLGCVIVYLFLKSKAVDRAVYEKLQAAHAESQTAVKLAEEKARGLHELHQSIQTKSEARESEYASLLSKTASLESTLQSNQQRLQELLDQLKEQSEINRQQQHEIQHHQRQLAEFGAQNQALNEKLGTQKQEIVELQKMSKLEFEKIAQQIFEEKTGKFSELSKTNLESILKPLTENIEGFKKKVEETYDKESKQRFSLEEKVKDLMEHTNRVSQEANNLATALKGQTKKQGDWGETILENILEQSGLVRDREYFRQESFRDDAGNLVRPDVIVRLPDSRTIVIDSKVSLNAYLRYTEAESKEQQELSAAAHLQSMRQHIDQLSGKKYEEAAGSLDFTIMFVPIEPAYLVAAQTDPELWSYAYTRRVLLVSPTNLIAVLKIVADLWKREQQSKNAKEIAKQGERLYEKFIGFVKSMEEIGKHIHKSQDVYQQAMGQLKEGRGNLISQAGKLKKLGIKSSKTLPASMELQGAEEEEADNARDMLEEDDSALPLPS